MYTYDTMLNVQQMIMSQEYFTDELGENNCPEVILVIEGLQGILCP